MANQKYGKAREHLGNGGFDWLNDDYRAILVDTGLYTPNFSTDEFLQDIPVGARVSTTGALTGKTNVLGRLDADNVSFGNVTGNESEAIVIYKHQATNTETTSRLFGYVDTATGLPVLPNGGPVDIQWHANGIMEL